MCGQVHDHGGWPGESNGGGSGEMMMWRGRGRETRGGEGADKAADGTRSKEESVWQRAVSMKL